ncbi:MAG: class I SAM-dependent methyltransferase [Ilumatobacteraceae bacterium]
MIDGQASVTAQRVAALRLGFDREPADYAEATLDDRLMADVAGDVDVSTTTPRMVDYLRARTRFFDRSVVRAIGDGVTQIVVGAAGYDARALRYRAPGVRWYELDHPDTQRDKRARLARLAIDASTVTFVPADFGRGDVGARLLDAGFDPGTRALFTLEGVIAYLDRDVVAAVLASLAGIAASGSRLAASFSTVTPGGEHAREQFRRRVAAVGEPASGPTTVDDLAELLSAVGWQRTDQPERAERAGFIELVRAAIDTVTDD